MALVRQYHRILDSTGAFRTSSHDKPINCTGQARLTAISMLLRGRFGGVGEIIGNILHEISNYLDFVGTL
jgi:hypothetical protein